jgi:hypothetical protein
VGLNRITANSTQDGPVRSNFSIAKLVLSATPMRRCCSVPACMTTWSAALSDSVYCSESSPAYELAKDSRFSEHVAPYELADSTQAC